MHDAFLELLEREHPSQARRHRDVAGAELDEIERRLAGEPISFSLSAGSWSAMSLSGDFSAHGDTLGIVLDELLAQLPPVPGCVMRRGDVVNDGSAAYAGLSRAA